MSKKSKSRSKPGVRAGKTALFLGSLALILTATVSTNRPTTTPKAKPLPAKYDATKPTRIIGCTEQWGCQVILLGAKS